MIEFICPYNGCIRFVEKEHDVGDQICQHDKAQVTMRRAIHVPGSRYEPKPTNRSMKGAYSE